MIIYLQMLETPEEKSKFEQLYLEYKGLMFHVAYEILHNEQDAEDAVHQAFVKIAENIKKIDDPTRIKSVKVTLFLLLRIPLKFQIFWEPIRKTTVSGYIFPKLTILRIE